MLWQTLTEKLAVALVAAVAAGLGGVTTYAVDAVRIEAKLDGRLTSIERSVVRIESRLYGPPPQEDRR